MISPKISLVLKDLHDQVPSYAIPWEPVSSPPAEAMATKAHVGRVITVILPEDFDS